MTNREVIADVLISIANSDVYWEQEPREAALLAADRILESLTTLPRLLKAREVAEQTGLSTARVYELTRLGELPSVHLGRAVRYSAAAVAAWLEAGGSLADNDL